MKRTIFWICAWMFLGASPSPTIASEFDPHEVAAPPMLLIKDLPVELSKENKAKHQEFQNPAPLNSRKIPWGNLLAASATALIIAIARRK